MCNSIFQFSDLNGKIAMDLAVPGSPIKNLLSASTMNGHTTKSSEVISDNANRSFQRSGSNYNHPPISPESESTYSMEEVFDFKYTVIVVES